MKKIIYVSVVLFFGVIFNHAEGQITITLQPGPEQGKDAQLRYQFPDTTSGNQPDFKAIRWTCEGDTCGSRGVIEFDLSSVPPGAIISSAYLSLYHNPTSSDPGHSTLSGSNACWIRRITTPWKEDFVSWNSQPSTTILNQIDLPSSINETMDYPNIDVTTLVHDMINHPDSSFGFMLLLQTEIAYRSLIFASSDHIDSVLRPKLEITYFPDSIYCTTIKPNANEGKDVSLWSDDANINHGDRESLTTYTWTNGGNLSLKRTFLAFDYSSIPENVIITSAKLSLFYNPTDPYESFDYHTGENEIYIQRVISEWGENTITWNNQPNATTINHVTIPPSSSPTQDYMDIDVTDLVIDMRDSLAENYGFMIRIADEINYYKSVLFASSDHLNSALHPELRVCYVLDSSGQEEGEIDLIFKIYPNPAIQTVTVEFNRSGVDLSLEIINAQGQLVKKIVNINPVEIIDISNFASGLYSVRLSGNDHLFVKKLIVK